MGASFASAAAVADLVEKILAVLDMAFPGREFYACSRVVPGEATIDVEWAGEPSRSDVDRALGGLMDVGVVIEWRLEDEDEKGDLAQEGVG